MAEVQVVKKDKLGSAVAANKSAIVDAAKLELGKVSLSTLKQMIKPQVPMIARGHFDTFIGDLVVANLTKFASDSYINDPKMKMVADAMMVTAYQNALSSFEIETKVKEFLSNAKIANLIEKVES